MENDVLLIDFLEFGEVMEQLKEQAKKEHPDKTFVPFWKLYLRNKNQLVIKGTVSDGKPGLQGSVELVKELEGITP